MPSRITPATLLLPSLLLLAPLPGCDGTDRKGPGAGPAEPPASETVPAAAEGEPPIELNWIGHWKGEDKRELLVREVKKEFEFLNPDVRVNLVFDKDIEGSEVDYKQRTAAAIARMIETGDMAWDVIFLDASIYEFVSELLGDPGWAEEHIVDFSTVPGFLESQKDFIVDDPRYRNKVGGILTGPFIENYIMSLWYNADVAAKTGLAIKERDMSFEDFADYAEKLHRYNEANGTSIHFIKLASWNRIDMFFETLFKSRFDDFETAVEKRFSAEKKRAFLETLQDFERISRYQPAVNEGWENLSTEDFLRELLYKDDALFVMGGTFMYNQFRGVDEGKSGKMKPVENPVVTKANGLIGDYVPAFAVMKNSPHREAAIDLVMSWATPKVAEKWVRYTKNLTGTRGNLSDAVSPEGSPSDDVYEKFVSDMEKKYEGIPMMYIRTPTYIFGEESPVSVLELRPTLAGILAGTVTAQDYFDEVMGRLAP